MSAPRDILPNRPQPTADPQRARRQSPQGTRRGWTRRPLVTVAAALLATSAAPAHAGRKDERSKDAPTAQAPAMPPDSCPVARPTLGPHDAPLRVILYLDPTNPDSYATWREARRILGEYEGALRLELGVVQSHYGQAAAARDVQAFALAVMDASPDANPGPVLAAFARRGWRGIARRLASKDERATLVAELGLDPKAVEARWTARACLDRQVRSETDRLHQLERARLGGNTVPLPVYVIVSRDVPPHVHADDRDLSHMRSVLDDTITSARAGTDAYLSAFDPPTHTVPIVAPNPIRDEPRIGMTIGEFGSPHHMAIYAESEVSTNLTRGLAAGLAHRRRYPNSLAVQVVARGGSSRTITLRKRLCAARATGLEMAYAHHLAGDAESGAPEPARALLDRLDAAAERLSCPEWEAPGPDPEPGMESTGIALPRGIWLDGQMLQSADLPLLSRRLRAVSAGAGPWLWPGLVR